MAAGLQAIQRYGNGAKLVSNEILAAFADLARLRRIDLRPEWADAAKGIAIDDEDAIDTVCEAISWPPASAYQDNPRAHEFPLLVYHGRYGWGVVERVEDANRLLVVKNGMSTTWDGAAEARIYDVTIPLPASRQNFASSLDVFKAAIMRRKSAIIIAVMATVMINIIAVITSIYTMQVYDRVIPRGAFSTLWVLSFGVIVSMLFDFTLRVLRANLLERESSEMDCEVSEFFFARAADSRLDTRPASVGTMAAQMRGLEQIRSTISSVALFALADLPFALLFIFLIMQLGGPLALVMLIAFPLAMVLSFLFARMIRRDTERSQVTGNRKNGLLVETFDAAETIKANRGQWFLLARWNKLLVDVHESDVPVRRLQAAASAFFGLLQQTAYITMIAWGATRVYSNDMTIGALIACSILAGRVNGPLVAQLPSLLIQWSYTRISLNMLDSILNLPQDHPPEVDLLRPSRLAGQLSISDLVFGYPGGRSGVSIPKLEIRAGERIGVIGGVGSGKSTMLKLMAGLYRPAQGRLLIDKLDMSQIAEDVLRNNIGYLPQDYRLVNGSLRDNLLLGIPDPGDDAIMEAAAKTGLAGMITLHPRGLDLEISEGGRGLSGGQRVLTGITRLLLAKPKLVLLDEPTSNLDPETEALVLRALSDWLEPDMTLVMVTHKMRLAALVSRLMIVASGQIAVDGPTKEVLSSLRQSTGAKPQSSNPVVPKTGVTTTVGVRSK